MSTLRKPLPRKIAVLETPQAAYDGYGAVRITVGKESTCYLIRSVDRCPISGIETWELEKLDQDMRPTNELYVTCLGDRDHSSCTCKGFGRWGKCKHVSGLSALVAAGLCPSCNDPSPAAQTCAGCQSAPSFRSSASVARHTPETLPSFQDGYDRCDKDGGCAEEAR